MKKSIYIAIISIIAIFCIIWGTWSHFSNYGRKIFSGKIFSISNHDSDDYEGSFSNKQNFEAFNSINCELKIADLKIVSGDTYNVEYDSQRKWLTPEVSVQNNQLIVKQNEKKHTNFGNSGCKIKITIPSGTELDNIKIDANVGDVSISNIATKELDAELDVGDLKITNVAFDSGKFDLNIGDLKIKNLNNADTYDITTKVSIGEASVLGTTKKDVKLAPAVNTDIKRTIYATVDIGEISISK